MKEFVKMLKSDPKLKTKTYKKGDFYNLETEVLNKNNEIQTESVGTEFHTFSVDGQEAFVTRTFSNFTPKPKRM